MFSFFREKKRIRLQSIVRRVSDLTSPNLPPLETTRRSDERANRCLPVLLVPVRKSRVSLDEAATALIKDISDRGVSLVLSHPYPDHEGREVVVGFWLRSQHLEEPELYFLHASTRHCVDIGGGYWQLGLELLDVVESRKVATALGPLVEELLPQYARH